MSENEKKPLTRKEFEEQIIKKAHSDEDFRKALIDNPKEALRQFGIQFSEEVEVKVVEESPKVVYLVLPVNSDELTDEQLDDVAGGFGVFWAEVDMAIMSWTSGKTDDNLKNKDKDAKFKLGKEKNPP